MVKVINTSDAEEVLWRFALAFYAEPGRAETCLTLQDEHKVNVCLLIGLHWLDTDGRTLSLEELADLSGRTNKWTHEIIEPLRSLRRKLKKPFGNFPSNDLQEDVRNSIKQAELLAEKKLLMEIERWSTKIQAANRSCRDSNLTQYFSSMGMDRTFIESIVKKLRLQ